MDTETYDFCISIYQLDKDYLKFYNLELYACIIQARQIKVQMCLCYWKQTCPFYLDFKGEHIM